MGRVSPFLGRRISPPPSSMDDGFGAVAVRRGVGWLINKRRRQKLPLSLPNERFGRCYVLFIVWKVLISEAGDDCDVMMLHLYGTTVSYEGAKYTLNPLKSRRESTRKLFSAKAR